MDKIEIQVLNPETVTESEKMMVCAARLTQRGHKIKNMDDFLSLYQKGYQTETTKNLTALPHPTIQKFGVINVVIVGASRRFLAQITRHQNEVKFMSASLQYSDYSGEANFVVPYDIMEKGQGVIKRYLTSNELAMDAYEAAIREGVDNDAAGYMAPQGLRNTLIISATPYQWKHMISQRICRRNTDETRYVMLRIWEQLDILGPVIFQDAGTFCMKEKSEGYATCPEGKMGCGVPIRSNAKPTDILAKDFPYLCKQEVTI